MDAIERRALYNLLRLNWLNEPTLSVESWQVEDYRSLPLASLFDKLTHFNIYLDRESFIAFADECDSPEDLTENLIGDRNLETRQEDQMYLLIFELWRRLMNEKPSLSILCNELDYQISLYDQLKLDNPITLQDALAYFIQALEENVDEGIPPEKAFRLISAYCAHDIETFLYDYIAEQIDEGHDSFAYELLENFNLYLGQNKWFKLLHIRLNEQSNSKSALRKIEQIIEDHLNEQDLEFNCEFLSFICKREDPAAFRLIMKHSIPLIKTEEELQDLLMITIDFFHYHGQKQSEILLNSLLQKRTHHSLREEINPQDPGLSLLTQLFNV